jgi:hypothetical protein
MQNINNESLVKALEFIAQEYRSTEIAVIARHIRLNKYSLVDIDGEYHTMQEVREIHDT